jgi:LuxR family maltose regulon positive regulatory protein
VTWITLDEGENDLARFLAYLIASLRTLKPNFGDAIMPFLRSPKSMNSQHILTGILNGISAEDQPFYLVLDDYHLITNQEVHQAVTFLLDRLPPNLHVLIASRSDPPLPLARMRGQGKIHELRAAELQFSEEEAGSFLSKTFGIHIAEEEIASLHQRTEGWITGLQMAALSLKEQDDPAQFVQDFAGDDRLIVDYLVEEVLSNLPQEKRDFLIFTGILRRLSGPLCDAVVYDNAQEGKGEELLASMEAENLFLIPLDNRRAWYRYHQLFADLLQKRLLQTQPELVPELHHRASVWFEEHGYIYDAIGHAFESGNHARAVELICLEAEAALMRSEVMTLRRWIEALPEENSYPDPKLHIFHAIALLLGGSPQEKVERRLQLAQQETSGEDIRGELDTVRAMAAMYRGAMHECVDYAQQALNLLPASSHFLRSMAVDSLGIAFVMLGNLEQALELLQEAVQIGTDSGNILVAVGALSNVAGLLMNAGELEQAQRLYSQALEIAKDSEGKPLPIAGKAIMGLGEIAREQNDLQAAERYLSQAIEHLQYLGEGGIVVAYLTLSRVFHAMGNTQDAFEKLEQAQGLAIQSEGTELDDILVAVQRARLNLNLGKIDAASRWVHERNLDPKRIVDEAGHGRSTARTLTLLELAEYTTLVRILIAQGKVEEVQSLLDYCLYLSEDTKQMRRVMECLILQALLNYHQGRMDSALQVLEQALELAEQHGYFRVFLEEGDAIAHLLYEGSQRGVMNALAGRLLAAFNDPRDRSELTQVPEGEIIEPLSERELDVLKWIAAGLSNQEVAEKLVITLSTVKWHSGNIYGKLGVKNRTQAVAKARQLGILDVDV